MEFIVCLFSRLDKGFQVKVADFGLAQYLDDDNQYKVRTDRKALPLRWMSVEAITQKVFSIQSDIVSKLASILFF